MGIGPVLIDAVTNDPERETQLRVSPDGTRMLFNMAPGAARLSSATLRLPTGGRNAREVQAQYQTTAIAMMEIGRPGRHMVSQEGARDAAWYPDGSRFAFSMLQGQQAMLASAAIGQEAAAVRFLTPTPCVAYDWQPSVSRDGKTVLFSTFTVNEPQTLAVMQLGETGAKCKLLFPGKSAQWSPVGRRFVFTRVVSGFDQIFTFDDASTQLTQVTFGSYNNFDPTWSPDGTRLAFVTDRNGTADVYVIGTDGTGLVQITHGPTQDVGPAWSSDGHIYFVSDAGGQWDLWRAAFAER
jgi:TolB protein